MSDNPTQRHGLVLTRAEGEEVIIGDPDNPIGIVRVGRIVRDSRGDAVRLVFDFPRHVLVNRREVAEQRREGRQ